MHYIVTLKFAYGIASWRVTPLKKVSSLGGKDARNNEKPEYKNEPDEIEMVKSQSKKRVGCHSVTDGFHFISIFVHLKQ